MSSILTPEEEISFNAGVIRRQLRRHRVLGAMFALPGLFRGLTHWLLAIKV